MTTLFSCRYNMDTNRVEARFEDGTTLAIDCIAVEDEYGNTPAQRAELDWLLYNKPLEYAQMVLKGEMEHPLSLGCAHGRLGGLSHRKRAVKSLIARRAFISFPCTSPSPASSQLRGQRHSGGPALPDPAHRYNGLP